jgi:MYXO-CTERM domain-containing protein
MKSSVRACTLLAFAGLSAWSVVMPARANLLTNGSFEAVTVTVADSCDGVYPWCVRTASNTPGWAHTGDGVDLVHTNYVQPPPVLLNPSHGLNFIDLNQSGQLGGVTQTVTVLPGQTYRLELDAAAWASNGVGGSMAFALVDTLSATVLGQGTFTDNVGGTWQRQSLQAQALGGQMTVALYGLAAPAAGMGVDNVVLTAAPEPMSAGLLLAGLAGLAGWRRRVSGKLLEGAAGSPA